MTTSLLRCPICHGALERGERVWRCAQGHTFDVARQGYVNLTSGRAAHPGDTAGMLDARAAVLGAGHLDVVTEALVAACRDQLPPGGLVEMGAGTAHHLVGVRRALGPRPAIAIDSSVAAAKRAARADPEWTTAVVADAWQPWPLLDGVAAAVLTIFAPRNLPEAARVLRRDGRLLTVTPASDHLAELAGPLGLLGIEPGKDERLRDDAREHFDLLDAREVRAARVLDHHAVLALARMGPSAHHRSPDELADAVTRLPASVPVTIAVRLTRFQPRRSA